MCIDLLKDSTVFEHQNCFPQKLQQSKTQMLCSNFNCQLSLLTKSTKHIFLYSQCLEEGKGSKVFTSLPEQKMSQ